MGLILIHFSDSHFKASESNPLLDRCSLLCGGIRSLVEPNDSCVVIYSGDIANFGMHEDYKLAEYFIQEIDNEITKHTGIKPQFTIIPGNHDHDFSSTDYDERMRHLIIENCNPNNPPSKTMDEHLFATQKPFVDFVNSLSKNNLNISFSQNICSSTRVNHELTNINVHLLNTTRFSRKQEIPGKLWFPTDILLENFTSESSNGAINIAILHHPYNWHIPDNAKELRRVLETSCDLIFTGHDHIPDIYQQNKRSTEQNMYIEGGILQDRDNENISSFNIVRLVHENQTFRCTTLSWNGSLYEQITEAYEHKYIRLRQPLLKELEVRPEWNAWLEEVGTDFRHPREKSLKMKDIFVYPDLQRLDIRKACSPMGIVRDRDIAGFIQDKKRLFIAGAEKIGKTTFSKQLFKDLRESGFATLLIRPDFSISRPSKSIAEQERIRTAVNRIVEKVYTDETISRFWQSEIKDRAVIIDDYDELNLGPGGRDKLIRWLNNNFGLVIMISAPGFRLTEILNRTEGDTILWTFEHADITESDSEMRFGLIGKWLLAGIDNYQIDHDDLYRKKLHYKSIIDGIIGKGVIPSLPIFILMMMQQLEAGMFVEGLSGMYGTLYELVIRDVVKGAAKNPADLEVKLNYLSEFAFQIYVSGKRAVDDVNYKKWHSKYCDDYNTELQYDKMISDFVDIGVFNKCGSDIGFKYPYYYCFFLARYLASNIHNEKIMTIIQRLCAFLHINDYANTMIFLSHMSKDPRIFQLIIETVRKHFSEANEYNLENSPTILPKESIKPSHLTLSKETPENEMLNELRSDDEESRPNGLNEIVSADGDQEKEIEAKFALVQIANSAHHSIRICGQLLRNFYGNMKGESQIEIIRECYGLCMRMISVLYDNLEEDKDNIANFITEIIQQRYPKINYDDLDKNVRRSLNSLVLNIAYGLIKHTARSLGLADLKPSYDKYINNNSDSITVSHHILDIATRLECFISDFPERDVKQTANMLDGKFIGREVLRVIVWEHFKLFKRDIQLRQRVCSILDIEPCQAPMIEAANMGKSASTQKEH